MPTILTAIERDLPVSRPSSTTTKRSPTRARAPINFMEFINMVKNVKAGWLTVEAHDDTLHVLPRDKYKTLSASVR